jgi:hypothetical protein
MVFPSKMTGYFLLWDLMNLIEITSPYASCPMGNRRRETDGQMACGKMLLKNFLKIY